MRSADAARGRVLVVPAAGAGSRLKSNLPKCLVPVHGRPMLEWLVELYSPYVGQFVVVAGPAWNDQVTRLMSRAAAGRTSVVVQERPTGMLDAVLLARPAIAAGTAQRVWITWCDQIAVHPATVAALASERLDDVPLALPTVMRREPYIHFARDRDGRIVHVWQRREGDPVPDVGESDAGLFSLSRTAFLVDLPHFAEQSGIGAATGERNLLPFIPWMASRAEVATVPCLDVIESMGINTPEELSTISAHLAARQPA